MAPRAWKRTRARAVLRCLGVLGPIAVAAVLVAPAHASASAPAWRDPTPAEGARVPITAGKTTIVAVAAADADAADIVEIEVQDAPRYVTVTATAGNPATASIAVRPPATAHGAVALNLLARDTGGSTIARTLVLDVSVDTEPFSLVGPGGRSRWGYLLEPATARVAPSARARVAARLSTATPLGKPNVVLALEGQRDPHGRLWIRVRLPILPNGSTGWLKRSALDDLHVVRTHLVVDLGSLAATLLRDERPIFRTRIGVGRAAWPTPRGEFYVREVLRGFGDPFYGPVAFGTSARSRVLTDWPGGGFIGIHGTNQPGLLPGRVSHGCIRMQNAAIQRLAKLMSVGTPVTVR